MAIQKGNRNYSDECGCSKSKHSVQKDSSSKQNLHQRVKSKVIRIPLNKIEIEKANYCVNHLLVLFEALIFLFLGGKPRIVTT